VHLSHSNSKHCDASTCHPFFLLCLPDGQPLLASGGSSGVISIWNLEKRRLHSVIREAHDGSIVSLHFFANEPILMSSAADNSIKVSSVFFSFITHKMLELIAVEL
jgi:WD40 repeat protein